MNLTFLASLYSMANNNHREDNEVIQITYYLSLLEFKSIFCHLLLLKRQNTSHSLRWSCFMRVHLCKFKWHRMTKLRKIMCTILIISAERLNGWIKNCVGLWRAYRMEQQFLLTLNITSCAQRQNYRRLQPILVSISIHVCTFCRQLICNRIRVHSRRNMLFMRWRLLKTWSDYYQSVRFSI